MLLKSLISAAVVSLAIWWQYPSKFVEFEEFVRSSATTTPWWAWVILGALITNVWASRKTVESEKSQRDKARNQRLRRQRLKSYLSPYPNSWYKACDSSELKRGGILPLDCIGRSFVVFREDTPEGRAHVLNAYCPHMGAHLGVGGQVHGDTIRCVFHGWRFRGADGQCTQIPYQDAIPSLAKAKTYPTVEYDEMVCFYFHADDEPPSYYPEPIPEIVSGQMTYRTSYDQDVGMHLQEFAENSADFQHFSKLHGQMTLPWSMVPIPFTEAVHKAGWERETEDGKGHIAYFRDETYLKVFGRKVPFSSGYRAQITFTGPGAVVSFRFFTPFGDVVIYQTHLPLEPLCQRTQFRVFADWWLPRPFVSFIAGEWVAQWFNDIAVWENKIFSSQPVLVKTDGPIMQQRRWYSQFFSPSSPVGEALDW
eukprot:TRINITY_DN7828_c0_g1_i1.p1 TRINITY_DN7828_c0_g1~~TRINITY_DN7828_c0_g1_i1.p1  ORF type:complete len:423 (+),score=76.39 TRINITY_DN7828_c0_g1_i1:95-1363(+)